jgi:hypothetical protein
VIEGWGKIKAFKLGFGRRGWFINKVKICLFVIEINYLI